MNFKTDLPNRKPIRLKPWDYATPWWYFVTLCIHNRMMLLGEIKKSYMNPNLAGKMVHSWWRELKHKFPTVDLDEFMVMPNHIHGIIVLNHKKTNVGADLRVRPPTDAHKGAHIGAPLPHDTELPSLNTVIQWFKTMTTNEYIRNVKQNHWPRFDNQLWQRSYYDRIIRSERALNAIRVYIHDNPRKWDEDEHFV